MTLILCNLIVVCGLQVFIGNSGIYSFGPVAFVAVYLAALLALPAAFAALQTPHLHELDPGLELTVRTLNREPTRRGLSQRLGRYGDGVQVRICRGLLTPHRRDHPRRGCPAGRDRQAGAPDGSPPTGALCRRRSDRRPAAGGRPAVRGASPPMLSLPATPAAPRSRSPRAGCAGTGSRAWATAN